MSQRVPITLPDWQLTGVRASVWLVDVGRVVTTGDRILELLADGVTIDLSAPATGRLIEQTVSEDDSVAVGQIVGWIEAEIDEP